MKTYFSTGASVRGENSTRAISLFHFSYIKVTWKLQALNWSSSGETTKLSADLGRYNSDLIILILYCLSDIVFSLVVEYLLEFLRNKNNWKTSLCICVYLLMY